LVRETKEKRQFGLIFFGFLENCTMLVDGFPVFGGQRAGGGNFSGKYRRSGLKFQMITTLSGIPIHLSPPHDASEHDSTVFNRTELRDESWELILADKAYIGRPHCLTPPKKNQSIVKQNPAACARFFRWHRKFRAPVEHCFARLHRFRFFKYSYWKKMTPRAVKFITWCEHVTRVAARKELPSSTRVKGAFCKCQFKT